MKKLPRRTRSKRRSFARIDYQERVKIEQRYCVDYRSLADIARECKRPYSTLMREIDDAPRKGPGRYSADRAQARADEKAHKQGRHASMDYEPLNTYVVAKLKLRWSPEQIMVRLPIDHPTDKRMRISYEAIYQYIYAQVHRAGAGGVKKGHADLRPYLRRRNRTRRTKGSRTAQKVERLAALPTIEDRPKEVEKRKVVGHWEGDTLVSRQSSARIKSANERATGIFFFTKTPDGTARACNTALVTRLTQVPPAFRKTLTQDRGTENREYETVEEALGLTCYFAHPYCSHERGSNENGNGLFRDFFPKKTDFSKVSDRDVLRVERLINSRPRKRYGGRTPYEVFFNATGVALEV
jgi:IS30 family transposase